MIEHDSLSDYYTDRKRLKEDVDAVISYRSLPRFSSSGFLSAHTVR